MTCEHCGGHHISETARTVVKRLNELQKETLSVCERQTKTSNSIHWEGFKGQQPVERLTPSDIFPFMVDFRHLLGCG